MIAVMMMTVVMMMIAVMIAAVMTAQIMIVIIQELVRPPQRVVRVMLLRTFLLPKRRSLVNLRRTHSEMHALVKRF